MMCATCREMIERYDQTSLRASRLLVSLEISTDPVESQALRIALLKNYRDMKAVRQEIDDHQASCHRLK